MVAKVTWTKTSVTIIGPLRNSLRRKHLHAIDLRAMVEEGSNYCVITPPKKLNVTVIDTYDEHQMAMTFSLAAQRFQLPSKILVVLGKPSPNTSKFSRGLRSIK
ncbi:hypothetical protein GOBAR_AA30428 [Gossypium barbadense]|uniref:Enolpyruvate transferase domain-containing protein n=1 Tax=Gossypium barbadense TaxID=3634 RepID=A0A2P5WGN9_GOSBA|nr:hypothetical protein GOBAR_AA30428 [Gossypium barbadense]